MSDILTKISYSARQNEPQTAWFDYLDLPYQERTERFAQAYTDAYRGHYARRTNLKSKNRINPLGIKHGDLDTMTVKKLNELWMARQAADHLEMPYPTYCELIINQADLHHWTQLPSIRYMGSEKAQIIAYENWKDHLKYHLVLPQSNPNTESFNTYLLEVKDHRANPQFFVKHLLDKSLVSMDNAISLFGQQLTEQATSL